MQTWLAVDAAMVDNDDAVENVIEEVCINNTFNSDPTSNTLD